MLSLPLAKMSMFLEASWSLGSPRMAMSIPFR